MKLAPVILLFTAVSVYKADENCESGEFTTSGECCSVCPPGEGVVSTCGEKDTECETCMDSLFYSDVSSHTEPCYPCTVCPESKNIGIPCMENFDTTCICMNGYYEISDGKCLLCKMCDKGFGVVQQCSYGRDTLCEECPANTYSDQKSNIDPCLPCAVCEDYEEMISDCTPTQDAECICKSFWLVPFSAVHCKCQIGRMCFAARSLSLCY